MIRVISEHLVTDPNGIAWAKAKLAGEEWANTIEKYRWALTNTVMKPFSKVIEEFVGLRDGGQSLAEYTESHLPDVAALVHAVLPLDRANALLVMKLKRDDPECGAGFLWITKADLEALAVKPHFGESVQFNSVARSYTTIGDAYRGSLGEFITAGTKPYAPTWLNEKFSLGFPGPESL